MNEPVLEPILRQLRFKKVIPEIKPNSVVVDIGCGHTPHLLNRLESYIRDGVGVDPLTQRGKMKNIRLISKMLGNKIPLKNGSADHVTLVAVLEHLDDPQAILSDAYRILKRGGTLVLTTPTPVTKPILEFLSFGLGVVSQREIAEHKRYFWKTDLEAVIIQAGFSRSKTRHQYFELFCNNFLVARK